MRVLLLTPPMVQLNTPYPATSYLTGFLRKHAADRGIDVAQADPSLALFLRIFLVMGSSGWLRRCAGDAGRRSAPSSFHIFWLMRRDMWRRSIRRCGFFRGVIRH